MTINDILELAKAGFTKEDIAKLTTAEAPAPQPEPQQVPQAPQPEPQQVPQAPQPEQSPEYAALKSQLDALTQMVQLNNILAVNQAPNQERTIDDIFAEIINPPQMNGKEGK